MARLDSLSALLDPSGKMLLAEMYDGVIENVQKMAISVGMKNTDLSGDPQAGTVEAKRFENATSKTYGTARTAGKGDGITGKPVTISIDQNKEFVEEIAEKDVKLIGVDGLLAKRSANHALRMAAELDTAFFAEGKTSGTAFTPASGTTAAQDILEEAIVTLETLKNSYIDGINRDMMKVVMDATYYSSIRKYLDTVSNSNVNTAVEEFIAFHGVPAYSSNRLPSGTKFELMMNSSIAQPVMSSPYAAERIPLSEDMAVEMFFYYGTKAVTPETILTYTPVV
jgi:hypothetical protein